jgi:hypothetical protein
MKESYEEDLANHFGLQRRGGCGNNVVLSVRAEGQAGKPLSSEIIRSSRSPLRISDLAKTYCQASRSGVNIPLPRATKEDVIPAPFGPLCSSLPAKTPPFVRMRVFAFVLSKEETSHKSLSCWQSNRLGCIEIDVGPSRIKAEVIPSVWRAKKQLNKRRCHGGS